MKQLKFYSAFLVLLCFVGCSSSSDQTKTNSVANSSATNISNTAQSNSTAATAVNQSVHVVQNVDPSAFNANPNTNARVVAVNQNEIKDKIGVAGRTAPDNSTVSSAMNAKGIPIETRTFKDNKYLVKVERIFTNPKTIKIYLKDGKIVEVGDDKLPNFTAASPGNILIAAGYDLKKLADQNQGNTENPVKKQ